MLANARAYWDAHELSSGLGEAMKRRAVIEQAKGMLMAAQGCDEDAAFELLVQASQRENLKLRDVAQRIVDNAIARRPRSKDEGGWTVPMADSTARPPDGPASSAVGRSTSCGSRPPASAVRSINATCGSSPADERTATPAEHDILAAALNDYFVGRGQNHPIAPWHQLTQPPKPPR